MKIIVWFNDIDYLMIQIIMEKIDYNGENLISIKTTFLFTIYSYITSLLFGFISIYTPDLQIPTGKIIIVSFS